MIKIFKFVPFLKFQNIAQSLMEGLAVLTNKMANAAALLRFKLLCDRRVIGRSEN
jgi:hypothetical protein